MTTTVVAWVAHTVVPGLPWAAAFALGAIVSPPALEENLPEEVMVRMRAEYCDRIAQLNAGSEKKEILQARSRP